MFGAISAAALLVSMVTCVPEGEGHTDNNDEQWSYMWYTGEPFYLVCNSSHLDVQPGQYVQWETPNNHILRRPTPTQRYSDTNYEVNNMNGIRDMELKIKNVKKELHGVYICTVKLLTDDSQQNRMILGLNYHGEKYRDISDKYRNNVVVAIIVTCIFIVPLGTTCFVYHFQYRTAEEKERRYIKKKGTRKFMYSASDIRMSSERIADSETESRPGEGAHDNPTFTEL